MDVDKEFEPFKALDRELVRIAKNVKVLSYLAWPDSMADEFLKGWSAGAPKIPQPSRPEARLDEHVEALERLSRPAGDHPIARFIARTAESYLHCARMLQHAGTPTFTEISAHTYGRPQDEVAPGGLTNLAAAEHLLKATDELSKASDDLETPRNLTAHDLQKEMSEIFGRFFYKHKVEVKVDPQLASKAAAGAERVRIRSSAMFSANDMEQLIQHEGFVHSATSLNGRAQPRLTCLSLNAPRTTATQEGLATFAEFITNSIDLQRLRRLALRIQGIHLALEGADFIEVFKNFLAAGQSERESYYSAARVFRGGDPKGKVAFTKDVVYLRGLLKTKTFLLTALQERKIQYTQILFVGRLTWGDVRMLEPFFQSGLIAAPLYQPDWVKNQNTLAAHLTFSNLTHLLPMEEASVFDFAPSVHKIGTTQRWSRVDEKK